MLRVGPTVAVATYEVSRSATMGLDHGLDWTGGHREPDQSQRDRGRAQGRDSFRTGDRDREHESGSPPFTSSSSFIQ